MTQKTAKDAMTPISEIFSLDMESKLDEYAPFNFRLYMHMHGK
jgi:CBS domain containing-hemolysin-like protein